MNKRATGQAKIIVSDNERTPLLRYRLILFILSPVLLGFSVFQAIKHQSLKYLLQRLGITNRFPAPIDVWIHAASVGEVNAALPLINAIQNHYPKIIILLTTTTPTGARIIQLKNLQNIYHCFLPLDYSACVSLFLNHVKPRCVIVMETEIWPNLFRLCHKNNIALYTVNGRLSQRTLNTKQWIKSLYASTLQYSTRIMTRSDNDSKAYIALGADSEKVKTIGNIKFAMQFLRSLDLL